MNRDGDATPTLDRLESLTIDDALGLLDETEHEQLVDLRRRTGMRSDESYELTAAFASLAGPIDEEMPAHLREKIVGEGRRQVRARSASPGSVAPRSARGPRPRRQLWPWIAVASLAVAVVGWWPRLQPSPTTVPADPTGASVVEREWTPTDDPAARGLNGEVLWDNATQTGTMRFVGLEPNDPSESQYQLWIFDATRDERHPVDGGVFDVAEGGETVVPIHAAVEVREPTLFAVTVEPPGGVVVSDRSRVVAVASVDGG